MPADYSRIHRLLKILTLIQGGSGWTPRRLAAECATTERTIYRDLRMLDRAGVPCFFDKDANSYSVQRDFFMPPVQLTLDETLALAALAEHVGGREQVPYLRAAGRAITKIRGQLPPALRRELDQIEDRVFIKLAASSPPDAAQDVYDKMRSALARRCALVCRYDSLSDAKSPTKRGSFVFKPYALFFSQRAWYVVGHHSLRDELRCLKLSRFTQIQPTSDVYEIPRKFSLSKHLGHAWRMIRGDKRYRIELHFDAEFADTISDTQWHPTQQISWEADDSIIFRCSVDGLDEIVWWVMSMGPHCRVNKPRELRARVHELARKMLELYRSS